MANETSESIRTPKFRVSFPDVFRPGKQVGDDGKQKYALTMLFPKGTDLSALKKAASEVVVAKWGADKEKWPKNLRNPFRNQGEKEYEGYEAGAFFITAKSQQRPGLVDQKVQDIIEERDFYPGCWAVATVRASAYEHPKGGKGVTFYLQNIQKVADGDPLGGRTRPSEDFEPVAAAEGTEKPAGASALFD